MTTPTFELTTHYVFDHLDDQDLKEMVECWFDFDFDFANLMKQCMLRDNSNRTWQELIQENARLTRLEFLQWIHCNEGDRGGLS